MSVPVSSILDFALPRCERSARKAVVGPGLKHLTPDDLAQELLLAVVTAIPRFDPAKGTIEGFFGSVIDDAVLEVKRRESGPKAKSQRHGRLSVEHDHTPAAKVESQHVDLRIDVNAALQEASGEQRHIAGLTAHFKVSEIVRLTGFSRSEVRTLLRRLGRGFGDDFFERIAKPPSARRDQ